MENEIKIFENEEFGKVRTVIKDEEPWLVGKDLIILYHKFCKSKEFFEKICTENEILT